VGAKGTVFDGAKMRKRKKGDESVDGKNRGEFCVKKGRTCINEPVYPGERAVSQSSQKGIGKKRILNQGQRNII